MFHTNKLGQAGFILMPDLTFVRFGLLGILPEPHFLADEALFEMIYLVRQTFRVYLVFLAFVFASQTLGNYQFLLLRTFATYFCRRSKVGNDRCLDIGTNLQRLTFQ